MRFNTMRAPVLAAMLLAASPGFALAQNAGNGTTGAGTTTGTTTTGTTNTPAGAVTTTPPGGNMGANAYNGYTGGGWGGGWWGLIGLIGLFGLAGGRRTRPVVPPATGVGTGSNRL
ncbi:MAG: hypothetical protein JO157_14935 [Acetobacteraceae bacterium]|nr:hypothetical protein [Acetobacteraceae bacterium]